MIRKERFPSEEAMMRCDNLIYVSLCSGLYRTAVLTIVTNLAMLLNWQTSSQAGADVRQGRYRSKSRIDLSISALQGMRLMMNIR